VLVFPSLLPEGFGRPLIEAMAMNIPVLATDIGPSREIVGDSAGILVPPHSRALADAAVQLLRSPDERCRMGAVGRSRVEAHYRLDAQIARMTALYQEVASVG
jgi:glycosyltransferase involved in cell wall biosynthesis